MKKIILLILTITISLWAELSFNDVQTLIEKRDYRKADIALQVVLANHPNQAKVWYAIAQTKAGLGDLPAAREALNRAQAIDPKLQFASASAVGALTEAITPQASKIAPVHQSSNTVLYGVLAIATSLGAIYYFRRPKPEPIAKVEPSTKYEAPTPRPSTPSYTRAESRPSYSSSTYSTPTTTEVHHHHHDSRPSSSGMSTLGTIATAGVTAAVVTSLMNDNDHSTSSSTSSTWDNITDSVSSTWDSTTSAISDTWEDTTSRSSSWSDSSSSSSSSWSDSSSSSSDSSSSWGD